MLFCLPVGGYRFLTQEEVDNFTFDLVDCQGPTGYFMEIDLEIPESLHDFFIDYPLGNMLVLFIVANYYYYYIHF